MRDKEAEWKGKVNNPAQSPVEGLWWDLRRNFPTGREESMWDILGQRFGERILIHHSPLLVESSGRQGDSLGNLLPGDSLEQKFYLRYPPPLSSSNPRHFLSTEAVLLHETKMVGL